MLTFALKDHYGKGRRLARALQSQGHQHVGFNEPADVLLIDYDPPAFGYPEMIELHKQLGVSLPGAVWRSRRAEWVESVATHPGFTRAKVALDRGLISGMAYPLMAGEAFVGVIELFSTRPLPESSTRASRWRSRVGARVTT